MFIYQKALNAFTYKHDNIIKSDFVYVTFYFQCYNYISLKYKNIIPPCNTGAQGCPLGTVLACHPR